MGNYLAFFSAQAKNLRLSAASKAAWISQIPQNNLWNL